MHKPSIARRSRPIPRKQWSAYEGWHTYGPQPESGSFLIYWHSDGRLGVRPHRLAGWWVYDQNSEANDGPFLSSRAAYLAAKQGGTGRIIMPAQINLDALLGLE